MQVRGQPSPRPDPDPEPDPDPDPDIDRDTLCPSAVPVHMVFLSFAGRRQWYTLARNAPLRPPDLLTCG